MNTKQKLFSLSLLLALLLSLATPAYAFDGRSGDQVIIKQGEVVNDDLYLAAQSITVDGTIKGDLIAGAQTIILNGRVEGDLIAAAETVIINGSVSDDVRTFAAAVQVGPQASIGGDLVAMGASVETKPGSDIAGDLVTGSGQALLAGEVGGSVLAGTGGLELAGPVKGDVRAYVNVSPENLEAAPMNMYLANSPVSLPQVRPGLHLDQGASVGGSLIYSGSVELSIPAGVVTGKVTRVEPVQNTSGTPIPAEPTNAKRVADWGFGLLRSIITLLLFGLLAGWLFPRFMRLLPENLKAQPLVSLGWGSILYAAVFFGVLAIIVLTVMLALLGLRGNIFWLGWLLLSALGVAFFLVTSYLSKVVVGEAIGKWILRHLKPALAEHRLWPMVVGVTALVLVIGLLRFPLLPFGFFGWLVNFLVILFGLGALWSWLRSAWSARKLAA